MSKACADRVRALMRQAYTARNADEAETAIKLVFNHEKLSFRAPQWDRLVARDSSLGRRLRFAIAARRTMLQPKK